MHVQSFPNNIIYMINLSLNQMFLHVYGKQVEKHYKSAIANDILHSKLWHCQGTFKKMLKHATQPFKIPSPHTPILKV